MALFSSVSQRAFLDDTINLLPEDAYPLTPEEHQAYMAGQVAGKVIDFSTEPPSLVDRPPPTPEELAALGRIWRNGELVASDPLIVRHRDERDMELKTTMTAAQFSALLLYRQRLRDWPATEGFPAEASRPEAPSS